MPTFVNISPQGDNKAGIWGFHGTTEKKAVAAAVKEVAGKLTGAGHTIHIMSGTHGYCSGKVGQVATRDERFANEDRQLVSAQTSDKKAVALVVHDFNNNVPKEPDPHTAVMAKLNGEMRAAVGKSQAGLHSFVLAYCCSAGTQTTR